MKPNNSPEDESRLRNVLASWRVNATTSPRFEERVWERIARREAEPTPGLWTLWFSQIAAALIRPRLAVSYVTLLLAAGLLAGFWQAQLTKARMAATLSARYVQMLDPYQMPHR